MNITKQLKARLLILFALFFLAILPINVKANHNNGYILQYKSSLPLYSEVNKPSKIANLKATDTVTILDGPYNEMAHVQVVDRPEVTGYADITYLKSVDAIVNDTGDGYLYPEMVEDIQLLKKRYPDLFDFKSVATTADGRCIYELSIGNKQASKSELLISTIHAREYWNTYLVMNQVEQILENYDTGVIDGIGYNDLLHQVCIRVIPCANPDGMSISQLGEAGVQNSAILENIRNVYQMNLAMGNRVSYPVFLAQWKSNAQCVDINRNFEVGFGRVRPRSKPYHSNGDFCGIAPNTEVETLTLMKETNAYNPQIVINYHSMGRLLYWDTITNQNSAYCRELTNLIQATNGYRMTPRETEAYGDYLAWFYASRPNLAASVTIETGSANCPFGYAHFPEIWRANMLSSIRGAWFAYTH